MIMDYCKESCVLFITHDDNICCCCGWGVHVDMEIEGVVVYDGDDKLSHVKRH